MRRRKDSKRSLIDKTPLVNRTLKSLILVWMLAWICGCSVMVSTPRQAEIQFQGLDDQYRVEVISIDDLIESNVEFPISDRYALMLDFQWLLGSDSSQSSEADRRSTANSDLAPWLMFKYQF